MVPKIIISCICIDISSIKADHLHRNGDVAELMAVVW